MTDGSTGVERPIIIKRRRKGGHDGHHGGAWKVAYADFVTAMWAFFILLWLLNTINSEQRKGIAEYFAPVAVSQETSGAGGLLGGRSITAPGAQSTPSSPITPDTPSTTQPPAMPEGEEDGTGLDGQRAEESRFAYRGRVEHAAEAAAVPPQRPGESLEDFAARVQEAAKTPPAADAAADAEAQAEAAAFQNAAAEIRQSLQAVPDLEPLARNLLIDQTAEGLRIQIVDGDRVAMFPSGSAQMYPQTRQVMLLLARVLAKVPNRMVITGHTDASAFAADAGRDNWSLSFERANALKRVLVAAGVGEGRVQDIAGRADRDLLVPDQPNSPRNRRVSIVLLRERGGMDAAGPAEGAESPPPERPVPFTR
ncbi:chemotaxis protein MotB [Azospirillum fermentarium]|uniref:flagellar motor protein MotB n=1 Tax=Azospirillum fermentarium TaxID=1233114 RepID=UPI00222687A5|nr:flagellar motor protein MotB [Azospirillum fermentarium]MCW2246998.1 chemotaxis protein MotB [Azospirillum fermentarium]